MNIMRAEAEIDEATSDRWELEYMEARCMNAVRDELMALAREVQINGGNPGVEGAIDYAFDIISDVAFDGYTKIDERAIASGWPLSIEYRKQGVA